MPASEPVTLPSDVLSALAGCPWTCTSLAASDFTGQWKGGVINTLPSGGTRQTQEIHMNLTQDGDKVTGTMGPSADRQVPIEGDSKDNRVTLRQGEHRLVELTLTGDKLVGTIKHANKPEDPVAKLELQRVKP